MMRLGNSGHFILSLINVTVNDIRKLEFKYSPFDVLSLLQIRTPGMGISQRVWTSHTRLLPVLSCTEDSALIYFMVVKVINNCLPSTAVFTVLHWRAALKTISKGTQYFQR
jgi:hypothetical protein